MKRIRDGYSVRVRIMPNNYRQRFLLRQWQALADCTGRDGIVGKKGETVDRILARGFMRVRFKSLRAAKKFVELLNEFWSGVASPELCKFYRWA